MAEKQVAQIFQSESDVLVHVEVSGQSIVATPEHPFYVAGQGWVCAQDLEPGSLLLTVDGIRVAVGSVSIEALDEPVTVYNLEVEDYHTYFVSQDGVLVHNTCRQYKSPVSGSGKEKATDVPSWAKGERPYTYESGKEFARRLMDAKYGSGNYKIGPGSEYNQIQKWGDRGFK